MERNSKNTEPFLSLTVHVWMSSVFFVMKVWMLCACAFHTSDGERKKKSASLNFMSKKRKTTRKIKRGTLKESLLASAVALLL